MKSTAILSVSLLVALVFCACRNAEQPLVPSVSAATGTTTTIVSVFEIPAMPATPEQLIPAVLSVERTALILAQRDGTITELHGEEGSRVTKGTVLARMNDEDLRTQLQEAELEVVRSQIQEKQHEALSNVIRSQLEQETALFRDGLTSKRQLDQAQFKLESTEQEVARVRLSTKAAQARVQAIKVEMEKTRLRAPFAGVITRRFARWGSQVVRNDKLFEVSQLGPLELHLQLPADKSSSIKIGTTADVLLSEAGPVVAQARIRRPDVIADAASNARGFVADVLNGNGLLPGQSVYVRLPHGEQTSFVKVPRAVFSSSTELQPGAASQVWIVENAHAISREVIIQAIDGDLVVVAAGLKQGDVVILAPPVRLKAGDALEIKRN